MNLFQPIIDGRMPLKALILGLLFIIVILGIILIISGVKAERKLPKVLLILLGVVLIVLSVYFMLVTLIFGYNS